MSVGLRTARSRGGARSGPRDDAPGAEHARLAEARRGVPWRRWGPYLSERAWGTVREDYSPDGDAWGAFTHDDQQRLCLALALWNGHDPILKERLFGLSNPEGNHGEDVKELYFYLDALPSSAYLRAAYLYPQAPFPYEALVRENARRGGADPEFEILDTRHATTASPSSIDGGGILDLRRVPGAAGPAAPLDGRGPAMRAFILTADDRPGMVASATRTAADAGVNLRTVAGLANGTTGLLALVGDDDALLRAALAARGGPVREIELVVTAVEDRPGTAAELAERLAAAGVNLELIAPIGMADGRIDVAIGAADADAVRRALAGA